MKTLDCCEEKKCVTKREKTKQEIKLEEENRKLKERIQYLELKLASMENAVEVKTIKGPSYRYSGNSIWPTITFDNTTWYYGTNTANNNYSYTTATW